MISSPPGIGHLPWLYTVLVLSLVGYSYSSFLQKWLTTFVGPVIGPIAGGFIAQRIGFKYVFIVIAGICAVANLIAIPFLHETYAPVILHRRALQGDQEKELPVTPMRKSEGLQYIWTNLSRPMVVLFRSLICFMLSLYMAFMYACYYLMVRNHSPSTPQAINHII